MMRAEELKREKALLQECLSRLSQTSHGINESLDFDSKKGEVSKNSAQVGAGADSAAKSISSSMPLAFP